MKRLIIFTLYLFTFQVSISAQTYYIDYVFGNDSNSGLSASTPFKHSPYDISAKGVAGGVTLSAGDTVVFKGGIVYKGQIHTTANGQRGNPIVFMGGEEVGYGTGKAIIDMENVRTYTLSLAGDWTTIYDLAIYNLDYNATRGSIIIGGISAVAVQGIIIDSVVVAFMENWGTGQMKSVETAAIFFRPRNHNNIIIQNSEFYAWHRMLINLSNGADSVYIRNNIFGGLPSVRGDSSGWYATAIRMNGGTSDTKFIWIQDNIFADAWKWGGDQVPELAHAPTKIVMHNQTTGTWWTARDVVIERNVFFNDKQLNTGTGSGDITVNQYAKNVSVRNNLFLNSVQYWGWNVNLGGAVNNVTNTSDSIYVENNTFIMRNYSSDSYGLTGVILWSNPLGDSVFVRNNIFFNDETGRSASAIRYEPNSKPNGVIDYNAYYLPDTSRVYYYGGGSRSLSWVQTYYGLDMNSQYFTGSSVFLNFPTNPANSSSGDYRLSSSASGFLKTGGQNLSCRFNHDINGVTRSNWSIGAYEYTNYDNTPLNLLTVSIINPTTIELIFSEALEISSALTKSNYSINNGIVVNSLTLSSDKKKVVLNTTQHITNQNYTVTVNSVKDLTGNIISSNNSMQYSF